MKTLLRGQKIGILGAGNMGAALISGLLRSKVLPPKSILASQKTKSKADQIQRRFGIQTTLQNTQLVESSTIVILAVKPQILPSVLAQIANLLHENHLLISIAAGVKTSEIENQIPRPVRVIRAMPNVCALVDLSATALCPGRYAQRSDQKKAEDIFSSIGDVVVLEETLMDAVTGLSGSGPAFFFLMMDALCDAGVKIGLSRDVTKRLAIQTMLGSAKLLLESQAHPGALKDSVTSPGGTAIEGIHTLEAGGFRDTVIRAVESACRRSKELGLLAQSPSGNRPLGHENK